MSVAAVGAIRTLLLGCGHAARDMHLPVLARQSRARVVGVVDPLLRQDLPDPTLPERQFRRLADVTGFPPEDTVVHVCTGPREHAPLLLEAAARGYRRFVVEKPLAASAAEAQQVLDFADRAGLDVLVVANWLASSLTDRLDERLRAAAEPPASVVMRQHKSRIGTSLASATHDSAFDVEMPHLVALAMHLFGTDLTVVDAESEDLHVGFMVRPGMAAARIRLRTAQGVPLLLESVLDAPAPERSVTARWRDGCKLRGYFPVSGRDFYSQLFRYDREGRMMDRELLQDETLRRFLDEAYRWFERRGPRPVSDVRLHRRVVELLDRARAEADAADPATVEAG